MRRRVVVTGIGLINPMGHDPETVWNGLKEGRSGVAKTTLFDATGFPTTINAEVKIGTSPIPASPRKNGRIADVTRSSPLAPRNKPWPIVVSWTALPIPFGLAFTWAAVKATRTS